MTTNGIRVPDDLDTLDFDKGSGLVTVVTQHAASGQVLMVAHANRTALERTIETGEMHYQSRTRGPWHKGETSGNVQRVVALHRDCDGDAVLALVSPAGPSCHTGTATCFGDAPRGDTLEALDATIANRSAGPQDTSRSYTQRLLNDRNARLKKLGEECAELVVACSDGDKAAAVREAADLYYHVMVALRAVGGGLSDVRDELARRGSPLTNLRHAPCESC